VRITSGPEIPAFKVLLRCDSRLLQDRVDVRGDPGLGKVPEHRHHVALGEAGRAPRRWLPLGLVLLLGLLLLGRGGLLPEDTHVTTGP